MAGQVGSLRISRHPGGVPADVLGWKLCPVGRGPQPESSMYSGNIISWLCPWELALVLINSLRPRRHLIASGILVNIGLGNGLLPCCTKLLPEPMLMHYQLYHWEQTSVKF